MAINRFSVHIGAKGKASPHFEYITASGKYEKKSGVKYVQSGNMPRWARNEPSKFWAAADEFERANGQTYKEHIISIPRELDEYYHKDFVESWIKKELGRNYPYTYALHETQASDGKTNPHAHIMFSTRSLEDKIYRPPEQFFKRYNAKDPAKGGAKKMDTGLSRAEMKKNLLEQRQRWDNHQIDYAYKNGYRVNVRPSFFVPDNKTMAEIQKEQKLERMLEQHPWYLSPEPVPPFVPTPPPAPEPIEPIRPQGESLAEKYARENAQNARITHDTAQTTQTPPTRTERTPQRSNASVSYDYDLGM